MRFVGAFVLVAMMTASGTAATRYLDGVGIPTTETPGGESMLGTLDWGDLGEITDIDYDIKWGDDEWAGMFSLLTTNIAGSSAQLIYADPVNDLILTAISADGPFSLDSDDFVDSEGYGGFEAWTLTDAEPDLNRYGTITHISSVPEPGMKMIAAGGLFMLVVFRRRFLGRSRRHAMAG